MSDQHVFNGGSFVPGARLDYDITPAASAVAAPVPMAHPLQPRERDDPDTPSLKTGHGYALMLYTKFPEHMWHPMLLAEVIVGEFAQTDWRDNIILEDPPTDPKKVRAEIEYLVARAAERNANMTELMAQADDFTPYFADLLYATPTSHPATWLLISTGLLVGRLVAMHFKRLHNRPRPVQIYPALMPPLLSPPHPAYPNAHALQANLMAECVALACPALSEPLRDLAARIGENREIAGVHFPSDRKASMTLVPYVMDRLTKGDEFNRVLQNAKAEWSGVRSGDDPGHKVARIAG